MPAGLGPVGDFQLRTDGVGLHLAFEKPRNDRNRHFVKQGK